MDEDYFDEFDWSKPKRHIAQQQIQTQSLLLDIFQKVESVKPKIAMNQEHPYLKKASRAELQEKQKVDRFLQNNRMDTIEERYNAEKLDKQRKYKRKVEGFQPLIIDTKKPEKVSRNKEPEKYKKRESNNSKRKQPSNLRKSSNMQSKRQKNPKVQTVVEKTKREPSNPRSQSVGSFTNLDISCEKLKRDEDNMSQNTSAAKYLISTDPIDFDKPKINEMPVPTLQKAQQDQTRDAQHFKQLNTLPELLEKELDQIKTTRNKKAIQSEGLSTVQSDRQQKRNLFLEQESDLENYARSKLNKLKKKLQQLCSQKVKILQRLRNINKEIEETQRSIEQSRISKMKKQTSQIPKWKEQIRIITHYNPREEKYKFRDQCKIVESKFEDIEREERHSIKVGRLEQEEDQARENRDKKLKKRRH